MRFHGVSEERGVAAYPLALVENAVCWRSRPTREKRRMAELPHGTAPGVKLVWMILACALGAAPAPAAAALLGEDSRDSLSLAECVALARERAPEVLARQQELAGARFDSTSAWKNHRPGFDIAGSMYVAPDGF